VGVVLILSSFIFGVWFRIYSLDVQVPWTDELASIFFSKNLHRVFYTESHTPFYYGVLHFLFGDNVTIYSARLFSAILSVFYLVLYFFLGRKTFQENAFVLFWILVCLSPVDIVFARQARHYAWVHEHVLLIGLLTKCQASNKVLGISSLLSGFIHPFAAIPTVLLNVFKYFEDKNKRSLIVLLCASSFFLLYYLIRFYSLGIEQVGRNLLWNQQAITEFYQHLPLLFFGDSYPRSLFFPVPSVAVILGSISTLVFFTFYRTKEIGQWLIIFLISILAIEILSFWVNFRSARYLVYLPALLIFSISLSAKKISEWILVVISLVMLSYLSSISILTPHEWEDVAASRYLILKKQHPEASDLVCANTYQADYYGFNKDRLCSYGSISLNGNKPILFMDFNGDSLGIVIQLMNIMRPTYNEKFRKGQIILFEPK